MLNIDAIHLREINMPLAHPFETSFGVTTGRRILLVEIEADGLTAWGECVAGEHPYFSDETIDTAWLITETRASAAPARGRHRRAAAAARLSSSRSAATAWPRPRSKTPSGISKRSSSESPLAELLGGTRDVIPCGVSIGIQPSPAQLMENIAEELAAGYQRIKLKCKPGWDTKIFEAGPRALARHHCSAATPTPPTA